MQNARLIFAKVTGYTHNTQQRHILSKKSTEHETTKEIGYHSLYLDLKLPWVTQEPEPQ